MSSNEELQDVVFSDYETQNFAQAPTYQDGLLAQDSVQSIDEITKSLNKRVLAQTVEFQIDQSVKYTIEDVYKNEILHRQQQIIKNLERERVFIKKQVDGKVETFYKGNDTYTNLLCSELNEINTLLDDLNAHKLFVEISFSGDSVELVGLKEHQVKRDGVYKTEIAKLHKIVVKNDVLEGKDGNGYKLSVDKLKSNESAYHDKIMMAWKKKQEEKKKAEQASQEDAEVEEKLEQEEKQEEQVDEVEQQVLEEEPVEEVVEQNPVGIESQGIQNIISKLGDFKGNEIFKEPEPQQSVEKPQEKRSANMDWFSSMVDDVLSEAAITDKDYESVLGISLEQPEYEQTSYKEPRQQEQENYASNQSSNNVANDEQKEKHIYLTEHDMKVRNFNTAAQELKQRIIQCYGGDEARAQQDEDYQQLDAFVKETNKKQLLNSDFDQAIEDWATPEKQEVMQQDLQAKRATFGKRYGEDFFNRINERAGGMGF